MVCIERRPKTLRWLLQELVTENMAGAIAYPDWEAMASTNEPLEEDWEKIPDNSMALPSYGSLTFSTVHFEAQFLDRQLSHFNRRCCISWELR